MTTAADPPPPPAAGWTPGEAADACPIARFLGVLDGHWSTLIVRELLIGPRRFGELKGALDGISPKTLTARLRRLEDAGVLTRTAYDESPPRVVYTLTDGGRGLREVLDTMAAWSERHLPASAARAPHPRRTPLRTR
jgi:DNA-binding HxlR family transcriptional regulator